LAASLILIYSMGKHFRTWKIDQDQLLPPSVKRIEMIKEVKAALEAEAKAAAEDCAESRECAPNGP
jgi:hypothetical protein